MAQDAGQWDWGKWVSGGSPKPGAQRESLGFEEGGWELLGKGMKPGVHGGYGGRHGGRPRRLTRGLIEGVSGS